MITNIQFGATFSYQPVIKVMIIKNVSCRSLVSVHEYDPFFHVMISHYFLYAYSLTFLGH
jgi:hypothetical protein